MSGAACNTAARITEEIESDLILIVAFAGWCAHLSTTGFEVKAAWQYGSTSVNSKYLWLRGEAFGEIQLLPSDLELQAPVCWLHCT